MIIKDVRFLIDQCVYRVEHDRHVSFFLLIGVSCRTDIEQKKNSFPFSDQFFFFFYSFCPEKLSLSIDAIGNPMKEKERKDGRCASVESVVSRADINYTFLINFLMNRCVSYFGQRKNSRILSSIVILMMVIVFSLSLQGR